MLGNLAVLCATAVLAGCTLATPAEAPVFVARVGAVPTSSEERSQAPHVAAQLGGYEASVNDTSPGPKAPVAVDPILDVQLGAWSSARSVDGGATERELCARLMEYSLVRAIDVDGGVALVFAPRNDGDLRPLRDAAGSVNMRLNRAESRRPAADTCAIFDMARGGVLVTTVGLPTGARMVFRSDAPGRVQRLREQAHVLASP